MSGHWTLQAFRFAGVGGVTTLVHVAAAYAASLTLSINPFGANLVGFMCSFGISYAGNFYWTFGMRTDHGEHIKRFAISSALCFLLSSGIVFVATALLKWRLEAALVVIALSIPPLSFALAKFWAFHSKSEQISRTADKVLRP